MGIHLRLGGDEPGFIIGGIHCRLLHRQYIDLQYVTIHHKHIVCGPLDCGELVSFIICAKAERNQYEINGRTIIKVCSTQANSVWPFIYIA